MPNDHYKKGARKEYKVMQDERENGCIAFRTAGSHSPFDVISIDSSKKIIKLIQCKRTLSEKMSYIDPKLKAKLEKENVHFTGFYGVVFEAL